MESTYVASGDRQGAREYPLSDGTSTNFRKVFIFSQKRL